MQGLLDLFQSRLFYDCDIVILVVSNHNSNPLLSIKEATKNIQKLKYVGE